MEINLKVPSRYHLALITQFLREHLTVLEAAKSYQNLSDDTLKNIQENTEAFGIVVAQFDEAMLVAVEDELTAG